MSNCEICKIIQNRLGQIYEDDVIYAYMDPTPIARGHIVVTTKDHYTILEQIPDAVLEQLFVIANRLSMISFELIDISGTNMIVNNGISAGQTESHITINIIPRKENDGLDYTWVPKKLSEEELSAIELRLNGKGQEVVKEYKEESTQVGTKPPVSEEKKLKEEENYLLKQLDRIP